MARRLVDHKRRAVAGIDRVGAVTAVVIEHQHVIGAVIVALKYGGAVCRHRCGVVIELGKADGHGCVDKFRQLFIGDDRAGLCRSRFIQSHIFRVLVIVDILEVIPHGIRNVDGKIIDVHRILRLRIALRNVQLDFRCQIREKVGIVLAAVIRQCFGGVVLIIMRGIA